MALLNLHGVELEIDDSWEADATSNLQLSWSLLNLRSGPATFDNHHAAQASVNILRISTRRRKQVLTGARNYKARRFTSSLCLLLLAVPLTVASNVAYIDETSKHVSLLRAAVATIVFNHVVYLGSSRASFALICLIAPELGRRHPRISSAKPVNLPLSV